MKASNLEQHVEDVWRDRMQWTRGDRMKKAMDTAGYSVQRTADHFQVSRGTISNWISGRVDPSLNAITIWAYLFHVPMNWILSGEWREGWAWPEISYEEKMRAYRGLKIEAEAADAEVIDISARLANLQPTD